MYESEHIRLRAMERDDLALCHQFVNDYETMRGAFSGMLYPSSMEDESRYLDSQSSYTREEYQFAVETLDGTLIGRCGFTRVDWKNRYAELGILIGDRDFRGIGYGPEAIRLLCRFGFEELNLHKIKASVFDFNLPAIRCYEKCGFKKEGLFEKEIFREGSYHDVVLMSLFNDKQ